jgi:hypothetical protein
MAGVLALVGLREGKYRGWIAIQVVWVIMLIFHAINVIKFYRAIPVGTAVEEVFIFMFWTPIAVDALVIPLLWIYIHSARVKAFCSAGRPSK